MQPKAEETEASLSPLFGKRFRRGNHKNSSKQESRRKRDNSEPNPDMNPPGPS
jgi:hypothetical protein